MSGFKGFSPKDENDEFKLYVNTNEINKLIKSYKKIKKYQKSSMHEITKLSGKQTSVDRLVGEYGIDSQAFE